jgi:hypothetical protein
MSSNIFKMAGIGITLVAIIVSVIWMANRGSQIRLNGEIQQVRVLGMPDNGSIVIVDFRFANPADYPFIVKDATIHLTDAEGLSHTGRSIAAVDAKTMFDYYSKENPDLGPAYNEMFKVRDRVEPGASMDRMICARFEIPEAKARARESLKLQIQDVDRATTEIAENREPE